MFGWQMELAMLQVLVFVLLIGFGAVVGAVVGTATDGRCWRGCVGALVGVITFVTAFLVFLSIN